MPKKKTLKGELAFEVIKRFPNSPSLTLAKKLFKENPEVYTSEEDARNIIRYYRGAIGRKSREELKDKSLARKFDESSFNPFGIPASEEAEYLPYYLSESCKKILCLYDVHIPYHSVSALTCALQKGVEDKCDTIFIGGDFLDFYQLSRYDKDPRRRGFQHELETGRAILKKIRELFPKARIYFKEGNHEERYENYLKVKAPELLDCQDYQMEVLLRFGELGVEWINEKRIVYAGKLRMLHGHEFRTSTFSPVNPARGYYMKAKRSMIAGHNHQTSEHTEPDIDDEVTTVWSVGCLSELHPAYMPINKWNHGFARVDIQEDGDFNVYNYRISNGEIL